jgi:hypothetical protein
MIGITKKTILLILRHLKLNYKTKLLKGREEFLKKGIWGLKKCHYLAESVLVPEEL